MSPHVSHQASQEQLLELQQIVVSLRSHIEVLGSIGDGRVRGRPFARLVDLFRGSTVLDQ